MSEVLLTRKGRDIMLKRKTLEAMGIDSDKIESIIEGHDETVSGLQAKIKDLEAKLAVTEEKLKEVDTSQDWKAIAEKAKADLENFKNDVAKKDAERAKETAYRSILKEAGISEKRIDSIIRISGATMDEMKIDKDGNVKDRESLVSKAKNEWADFIPVTVRVGANVPNPPANTGKTLTRKEILDIKDTQERQKAIAENLNLFQKG